MRVIPKHENLNWNDIQAFYNDGNSIDKCLLYFSIPNNAIGYGISRGKFKTRNPREASNLKLGKPGPRASSETRAKLSAMRIKYLQEHPDRVPYLLNHKNKGPSYPERYFTDVFSKEGFPVVYHYRIGVYELDFALVDEKVDIEIDGNQHYCDPVVMASDIRRNKMLEALGWKIVRIRWSHFVSLLDEDKKAFVYDLKSRYVLKTVDSGTPISVYQRPPIRDKCRCGKTKTIESSLCKRCEKWAVLDKETKIIYDEVMALGLKPKSVKSEIARRLGASCSCVNERCVRLNLPLRRVPRRKPDPSSLICPQCGGQKGETSKICGQCNHTYKISDDAIRDAVSKTIPGRHRMREICITLGAHKRYMRKRLILLNIDLKRPWPSI